MVWIRGAVSLIFVYAPRFHLDIISLGSLLWTQVLGGKSTGRPASERVTLHSFEDPHAALHYWISSMLSCIFAFP